jgi:hypothetical protein
MEDKNFVVYAHYIIETEEIFYIGEGRPKRAKDKFNRNKHWNNKVAKHGGFGVKIISKNLTKREAEELEIKLIEEYRNNGSKLVNVCNGPMIENHWLLGKPKEMHPMFGKTFKAPWISESNIRRTGRKLKPRPDLVERNKSNKGKSIDSLKKKVICAETNIIYESLSAAAEEINGSVSKISRACINGGRHKGFHWKKVT